MDNWPRKRSNTSSRRFLIRQESFPTRKIQTSTRRQERDSKIERAQSEAVWRRSMRLNCLKTNLDKCQSRRLQLRALMKSSKDKTNIGRIFSLDSNSPRFLQWILWDQTYPTSPTRQQKTRIILSCPMKVWIWLEEMSWRDQKELTVRMTSPSLSRDSHSRMPNPTDMTWTKSSRCKECQVSTKTLLSPATLQFIRDSMLILMKELMLMMSFSQEMSNPVLANSNS